jgi:hypothetical protein
VILCDAVWDIAELHVDEQGGLMARKDLEKETERPRYYSQFWLDVAAGRRVIGAGKAQDGDETEAAETEGTPELTTKAGKAPKSATTPSVVEAEPAGRRTSGGPLRLSGTESLADLAAAAGLVDLDAGDETAPVEEEGVSEEEEPLVVAEEADLTNESAEEEPYSFTDLYDEEEEEEEEEGWGSSAARRGKKHNKKPEKPRRREKGRDF